MSPKFAFLHNYIIQSNRATISTMSFVFVSLMFEFNDRFYFPRRLRVHLALQQIRSRIERMHQELVPTFETLSGHRIDRLGRRSYRSDDHPVYGDGEWEWTGED
jgi:hypothetical protein